MATVLNVFLYGIIMNQSYLYYVWYKRYFVLHTSASIGYSTILARDKRIVKIVVAFLLFLATVTCAFDVAMSYMYLVTNWGKSI